MHLSNYFVCDMLERATIASVVQCSMMSGYDDRMRPYRRWGSSLAECLARMRLMMDRHSKQSLRDTYWEISKPGVAGVRKIVGTCTVEMLLKRAKMSLLQSSNEEE